MTRKNPYRKHSHIFSQFEAHSPLSRKSKDDLMFYYIIQEYVNVLIYIFYNYAMPNKLNVLIYTRKYILTRKPYCKIVSIHCHKNISKIINPMLSNVSSIFKHNINNKHHLVLLFLAML